MESRRAIYYRGNSVKPRNVSIGSKMKRLELPHLGEPVEPSYMPPIIEKVYATLECVWCTRPFNDYRIVCDHCHNCQYCGMVAGGEGHCQLCGNRLPDELKNNGSRRSKKIKLF